MFEFWSRRRRALLTVAAGAAGLAVAYQWWTSYYAPDGSKAEQPSRVYNILLNACLTLGPCHPWHSTLQMEQLLKATTPSPADLELIEPAESGWDGGEGAEGLDRSMDSHFGYIQDDVAPKELDQLLPRICVVLHEMTDIQQVKQRLTGGAGAAPLTASDGTPLSADDRARLLAAPCFTRALAACWLVPMLDLFLRVKLNIVGRHMFLQEKLTQLRQPSPALGERQRLPPRLTALAIESFLKCDHLVEWGSHWIINKVGEAVSAALVQLPSMKEPLGPADVSRLMSDMLTMSEVTAGFPAADASATGSNGCSVWADVLVGPEVTSNINTHQAMSSSADAYRRAMSSAAMVEELNAELRIVLSNYRFGEALRAAAQCSYRTMMLQVYSTFPVLPPQQSSVVQTEAVSPAAVGDGRESSSSGGSEGEGGHAGGVSVLVPRRVSCSDPAAASPLSASRDDAAVSQPVSISNAHGGAATTSSGFLSSVSSIFAGRRSSTGAGGLEQHSAAGGSLAGSGFCPQSPPVVPLSRTSSIGLSPLARQPSLSSGRPLNSARSSLTGSRGSLSLGGRQASACLLTDRAPVPLPLLFRVLYDACEPLFSNTKQVTKVGALLTCEVLET